MSLGLLIGLISLAVILLLFIICEIIKKLRVKGDKYINYDEEGNSEEARQQTTAAEALLPEQAAAEPPGSEGAVPAPVPVPVPLPEVLRVLRQRHGVAFVHKAAHWMAN